MPWGTCLWYNARQNKSYVLKISLIYKTDLLPKKRQGRNMFKCQQYSFIELWVPVHFWFLYFPNCTYTIGEGNGNPLQYSCPENPTDRGAWRAIVHGVTKIQTWLKWLSTHACNCTLCIHNDFIVWNIFKILRSLILKILNGRNYKNVLNIWKFWLELGHKLKKIFEYHNRYECLLAC